MTWLDDLVNHLRHGAAPEEREILVARANKHEETLARADAVLEVANKRLASYGRMRIGR